MNQILSGILVMLVVFSINFVWVVTVEDGQIFCWYFNSKKKISQISWVISIVSSIDGLIVLGHGKNRSKYNFVKYNIIIIWSYKYCCGTPKNTLKTCGVEHTWCRTAPLVISLVILHSLLVSRKILASFCLYFLVVQALCNLIMSHII